MSLNFPCENASVKEQYYSLIRDEDSESAIPPSSSRLQTFKRTFIVTFASKATVLLAFCFMCIMLSFWIGRYTASTKHIYNIERKSYREPLISNASEIERSIVDTMPNTFQYNRTFSEAPSNITDSAWDGLIIGRGFFNHPKLARNRSTVSVYHQLHCVVGSARRSGPNTLDC